MTDTKKLKIENTKDITYFKLNNMVNIPTADKKIQLNKDREAVRAYFLEYVNPNTVFFHTLEEKLQYLVDNDYIEEGFLNKYSFDFIQSLFDHLYSHKFRFKSFMGAYKFYTQYALKTNDNKRFLERYEDRIAFTALYLADGDEDLAWHIAEEHIEHRLQMATPTFLNAGKKRRGEMVSCFLIDVQDNMESIGRAVNSSLQLSKRGGGVGVNLSYLREAAAAIKAIENAGSGVVPVMKLLEDAFSYANQLGQRNGAGVVYLNAFHPDVYEFLSTKKENADEKIRVKTLSLGLVVPDKYYELLKTNEPMYLFSPYDVERIYGKPFGYVNITEHYEDMVANKDIKKYKINARELEQEISRLQQESGYPYIMNVDTANKENPVNGTITMSNTEMLKTHHFEQAVDTAVRALTAVSDMTSIQAIPSVERGNSAYNSIGLGAMGLHTALATNQIHYGSAEALELTDAYFMALRYYALKTSNQIAKERGESFFEFDQSAYADGSYIRERYIDHQEPFVFQSEKVAKLFDHIHIPTPDDWATLNQAIMADGLYNAYLLTVAPTGSISYINEASSSIHPIVHLIENRQETNIGSMFYPA
ncbi:MAG: ribonucleotide-diphosphate reductase subunit alpha, partial [Aerococcus viridans]